MWFIYNHLWCSDSEVIKMSAMSPSVHLIINKTDTLSLWLSDGSCAINFQPFPAYGIRIAFAHCTCDDLRHFSVHIWKHIHDARSSAHSVQLHMYCIICYVDTFNPQPSLHQGEHRTSSPSVFVCLRKFIYWHTTTALIAKIIIIIIMAMSARYSTQDLDS